MNEKNEATLKVRTPLKRADTLVMKTMPEEPTTDPEFSVDIEEDERPRGVVEIVVEGYPYTLDFRQLAASGYTTERWYFWIDLLSRAEREFMNLETAYRQFRANAICDLLVKDTKVSEWKARAFLESTETFRQNKASLAESKRTLSLLQGVVEALRLLVSVHCSAAPGEPPGCELRL